MTDQSTTLDLDISGMSCASCAARIEKRLNQIDGVQATVNYATEKALVTAPAALPPTELVAAVEQAGYGASLPQPEDPRPDDGTTAGSVPPATDNATGLCRRLVVSAALSLPVVVLAMVSGWQFPGWQWLSLVLATPVVAWGGWPFHASTWRNLRRGATTMDTLVSLGTLAAYGWSVWALVVGGPGAPIYLEVAAGVTTFLLAGRFLESRSKRQAGAALRALLELGAKEVAVRTADGERRIPIGRLAVGQEFLVRPGEQVATDGVVIDGESAVDNALLTGESVPVDVRPGTEVIGAAVNAGGRLVVRATRIGADTQLAQLARLVEAAQTGKAPVQRLADRISAVFVPVVLGLAGLTLLGWLVAGAAIPTAFTAAVAVLVVACPCALGLATPTALLVGTGRAAQLGIVIKGPEVLESTRAVDTVVLDKTGTVTTGTMEVRDVLPAGGESADAVLRRAAAVEQGSEHPIGRAIVRAAHDGLPPMAQFASSGGLGVTAEVDGVETAVGRPEFVREAGHDLSGVAALVTEAARTGVSGVVVGWAGRARGLITVADEPKPTSRAAVDGLRGLGLHPMLLTGDQQAAARRVADQVGIEDVRADVLPADKLVAVRELQQQGRVVAVVGDGVNDAAALAQADLGIAVGTGADVAIQASDLTLVGGDLRGVVEAIRLSRRTLRVIKGNLFWAFAYNAAAIPVAAAGLLSPMVAGAAMALSSVCVVANSLRLRRFQPAPERPELSGTGRAAAVGPGSSRAPAADPVRR